MCMSLGRKDGKSKVWGGASESHKLFVTWAATLLQREGSRCLWAQLPPTWNYFYPLLQPPTAFLRSGRAMWTIWSPRGTAKDHPEAIMPCPCSCSNEPLALWHVWPIRVGPSLVLLAS